MISVAQMRINIDQTAVKRMLDEPGGPVAWNMDRRAKRVATRARQLAPGSMKRKITTSTASGHVRVECSHPAVLYVIQGTRPHIIRPNRRKALRWSSGGRFVFAKLVHHPGNRANNFLLKAMREASGR
jgi:hypothetical protein